MSMAACQLVAPGVFDRRQVEVPEPGPRQALVRIEGCGICSSSLPLWEGRPWFSYPAEPGAPGHEGWGRVERLGSEVEGLARGERVALLSYRAFADYDLADADALVPIPHELDDTPFPGEAFGCGFNVWARSGIDATQTVAVVGIGFLGALLVALARSAGARVIAISRRDSSLELAESLGAQHCLRLDDAATSAAVMQLSGGRGCERVIEATGLQQPLDLASSLVATRGRLVIAGYHQDGPRQVDMQSWNWRGIDVVNAHEREREAYVRGMREAAAALAAGRIDASALLTHRLPFDEVDRALELTRTRPDGFVKAVVLQ